MTEDERLKRLNMEWRRHFDETIGRLKQEQRCQFEKMQKTMHDVISVLCNAIKDTVRDPDTILKMGDLIQAGLARLQEIDRAADAERDPGMRLN